MNDCKRVHHYQVGIVAAALGALLLFTAPRYKEFGELLIFSGILLFIDDYKDYERCNI